MSNKKIHQPIIKADTKRDDSEAKFIGGITSPEVSDLLFIDKIETEELKELYIEEFKKNCEQNRNIIQASYEKEEARISEQQRADISYKKRGQFMGTIFIFAVLASFLYCQIIQVPTKSLWAFSIFFVGTIFLFFAGNRKQKNSHKEK